MQERSPTSQPVAVIKIGGSVLTKGSSYRRAARFVWNRRLATPEERLVVVVSAQEGTTDSLERAARKIAGDPNPASLDLLWSTGEVRSAALLALHLQALGVSAIALNTHETGLTVPANGRGATHVRLNLKRMLGALSEFPVVVAPGFLATDTSNAIVSLGRGGTDLTAILLAEGLNACRCELIKDVPGYFTADPHRNPAARPIPFLTFEHALELARNGCDLVQKKAIEEAARCGLALVVRGIKNAGPVSRIGGAPVAAEAWNESATPEAVAS
ncbi:MAG: hypothetical protein ACRD4S_09880 [Candidatus Acidiferrales bacterium]